MIHEALGPDDRGQARPAQRLARQARGVARQGRVALAARGLQPIDPEAEVDVAVDGGAAQEARGVALGPRPAVEVDVGPLGRDDEVALGALDDVPAGLDPERRAVLADAPVDLTQGHAAGKGGGPSQGRKSGRVTIHTASTKDCGRWFLKQDAHSTKVTLPPSLAPQQRISQAWRRCAKHRHPTAAATHVRLSCRSWTSLVAARLTSRSLSTSAGYTVSQTLLPMSSCRV